MKLPPLPDILSTVRAASQSPTRSIDDALGAPPGFATRVVALARHQPSAELLLWTRLSTCGLGVAVLIATVTTLAVPTSQNQAGRHTAAANPVLEWIQTAP